MWIKYGMRIREKVEKILKNEPHLTYAEAIAVVMQKREKSRLEHIRREKRLRAKARRAKGKPYKGVIRTVSGGAVSPR